MASLNRVTIIGNVGREPEMRFTPNGNPVTSFPVAVNDRYKSGEEWQERTEWFNVVAWNRLAETCNEFLNVGSKVYIDGRQQTRSWEGQDGQKKYRTELIASRVLFLDKPKGEASITEETLVTETPAETPPLLEPDDEPF